MSSCPPGWTQDGDHYVRENPAAQFIACLLSDGAWMPMVRIPMPTADTDEDGDIFLPSTGSLEAAITALETWEQEHVKDEAAQKAYADAAVLWLLTSESETAKNCRRQLPESFRR